MSHGRLTSLQSRVLALLAGLEPAWTLTGGAALAGFHLEHRTTRDLDLFFRDRRALEKPLLAAIESRFLRALLKHERIQTSEAFVRYRVWDDAESIVVDLVAEPVPSVAAAERITLERDPAVDTGSEAEPHEILIDSRHEILVNKLNALVSRTELRDLVDVEALLRQGGDLTRALGDAGGKDSGFSPLVLVGCLASFPVHLLASRVDLPKVELVALEAFVATLTAAVARAAFGDTEP